jgi:hypothetical protein
MKKVLLYLILIMAIGMAGTVAYVSVSGLLKVFTGAGTLGLLLFSAIEISKMVATSAIHTYGKKIGLFYNILLSLAILISMAITSMGIYGFLSSSYKESFAKMENVDSQVELLETKRNSYQKQLDILNSEKESITNTISELSKGLSNNVVQYKDPKTGQIITSTSSSTRKTLEKQLNNAIVKESDVNTKVDKLNTLVFDLENQILETKLGNDSANELGTLKYLADITGKSMDEVMKWFIFLLIIIGDPMAVLMVIVFNKIVNKEDESSIFNPITGEIDLSGPIRPMPYNDDEYFNDELLDMHPINGSNPESIMSPTEEPETNYIKQIQNNLRRGIPIEDDVVSDVVNEYVELPIEDNLPEPITDSEILEEMIEKNKSENVIMDKDEQIEEIIPVMAMDAPNGKGLMSTMDIIDEIIENTPEEQIIENVEEVKQLKREPVIPRGKIIESDVVKKRDFSVDVPQPNITRIGTNKEVRDNQTNVIFFKRKRSDELSNED